MELLDILAKPIQVVKDILDLEPDLESTSLASQFVAIKQQLAQIQKCLDESRRIDREKDIIISELQKRIAAHPPAESADDLRLPAIPRGPDPSEEAQASRTEVGMDTLGTPTRATGTSEPLTETVKASTHRRARTAPKKRGTAGQVRARRKKRLQSGARMTQPDKAKRMGTPITPKRLKPKSNRSS
ncbi:MAG TPA: hypothetical protein PLU87_10945 [Sedimentisphaerales bacterium]|nr:hypothetical protein [Sedimentisphaerales bacterium]HRS11616.1 hypothetical protein [Sedimentisphaerales bacterium]HRV48279.1 hypothetical protein [Sedimentisphaerales bacterium]